MATKYTHSLHVVVRSQAKAIGLSAAAFKQFPEIGPNNVGTPLVDANDPDDGDVIAWSFSAPVKQAYIDWLAAIGYSAGDAVDPDVTWCRTDRDGTVRKRSGDENPEPIKVNCKAFLAECGLKVYRPSLEI